jgi:hypothetical protein
MSTKITNVVALLKEAKPADIAELEFVKDRFITIHNQIHGTNKGELIYHKEVFNYKKMLSEKPELRDCSAISLYGCFLDINVNGHSLEQGSKPDCYIIPRSFKVGTNPETNKGIYEKRATLQVSPYGELKMRMRAGQVKYADDPIVVYDCDEIKIGTNDKGKLVVKSYEKSLKQPEDAKIIACFVRIERPDGTYEMPFLDMPAVERLKGYSARQNNGTANALYTSNKGQIDTGFLMAKTLKHALTSYPKVQTGKFTTFEPLEETPAGAITDEDIYGINADEHSADAVQDISHEEIKEFDAALNQPNENEPTMQYQTADEEEPAF